MDQVLVLMFFPRLDQDFVYGLFLDPSVFR